MVRRAALPSCTCHQACGGPACASGQAPTRMCGAAPRRLACTAERRIGRGPLSVCGSVRRVGVWSRCRHMHAHLAQPSAGLDLRGLRSRRGCCHAHSARLASSLGVSGGGGSGSGKISRNVGLGRSRQVQHQQQQWKMQGPPQPSGSSDSKQQKYATDAAGTSRFRWHMCTTHPCPVAYTMCTTTASPSQPA